MSIDSQIKSKTSAEYREDSGGSNLSVVPVIGIVKSNIDETRSGQLRVYCPQFGGGNPDSDWITVKYLSPFIGLVGATGSADGFGDFVGNPQSYGFWAAAPDIGSEVVCLFINGDRNNGFYLGCLPPISQHHMVPAIGASSSVVPNSGEAQSFAGADRLPVSENNTANPALKKSSAPYAEPKPVHSHLATTMSQQGLIRDPVRGPISSSSMRETPSRVFGISTKGTEIYEGGASPENIKQAIETQSNSKFRILGRTSGHSLVMDDGTIDGRDQLVRIRTSLGHQITMSDDGQTLFITHANGQSYVELGAEGTVDVYAMNSVNIRTEGDLNLHADRDINLQAGRNIRAKSDENINIESTKSTTLLVGLDWLNEVKGKTTAKSTGPISLATGATFDLSSVDVTNVRGRRINLNSGGPAVTPPPVTPLSIIKQTDTSFSATKGWLPKPASLDTIVSRAPAHMPWEMAGKGVDVKINKGAAAPAPTPAAAAVTATAPATPAAAAPAQASNTVTGSMAPPPPTTPAGSKILTPTSTAAIVSQQAVQATTATNAIQRGIGAAAVSASQLEVAGILKSGAAAAVDKSLIEGLPANIAIKPNMLTGGIGASSVQEVVGNTAVGITAISKALDVTAAGLAATGVLTGNEKAVQAAGLITLGSKIGVPAVKSIVDGISSLSAADGQTVSGANFAAKLADSVNGGIKSIGTAVSGIGNSIKAALSGTNLNNLPVSEQAFAAIESSLPDLKSGVPNPLGGAIELPTSSNPITVAAAEYDAAQAELEAAQDDVFRTRKDYYDSKSQEDYDAWKDAERRVSESRQKIAKASTSFFATSSPGTSVGSAQTVAASTQNILSGVSSIATSTNSGLNALPGGLSAISGTTQNITGTIKTAIGVTAAASDVASVTGSIGTSISGINNAVAAIPSISGAIPASNLESITNSLNNQTGRLGSAATGALASLQSQLSSLGNAPGQPKLPAIAVATVDRAALTAQMGATLGDAKIPTPMYTPRPPTPPEPDTALSEKVAAANKVKDAEAALKQFEAAQQAIPGIASAIGGSTGFNISPLIRAAQEQEKIRLEQQLALAREEYATVLQQG